MTYTLSVWPEAIYYLKNDRKQKLVEKIYNNSGVESEN